MLSGTDALKMIRFVAIGGDEPRRRRNDRDGKLLFAGTTATLIIAAFSYWIGLQTSREETRDTVSASPVDQTTSTAISAPARQQISSPVPSANGSDLRQPETAPDTDSESKPRAAPANEESRIASKTRDVEPSHAVAPQVPPRIRADSLQGVVRAVPRPKEMVRIGRFESRDQAEKAWTEVLQRSPDMQRLSAVPVQIKSLRNGKSYYRLQLRTSSRAHSELVCQRAHDLNQTCTIIAAEEHSAESPL